MVPLLGTVTVSVGPDGELAVLFTYTVVVTSGPESACGFDEVDGGGPKRVTVTVEVLRGKAVVAVITFVWGTTTADVRFETIVRRMVETTDSPP